MTFAQDFADALPDGMTTPSEFEALFGWMETAGCILEGRNGEAFGVLDPSEVGKMGGSTIAFHRPAYDGYWTGCWDPTSAARLCSFAYTGGDGSAAAFWLDDQGRQQIVHLGSGSGSVMVGIMVATPLDFLRLLGIGYREVCWPEEHGNLPEAPTEVKAYRQWLRDTFNVTPPRVAQDVVLPMTSIDAPGQDPLNQWLTSLPRTPKPV